MVEEAAKTSSSPGEAEETSSLSLAGSEDLRCTKLRLSELIWWVRLKRLLLGGAGCVQLESGTSTESLTMDDSISIASRVSHDLPGRGSLMAARPHEIVGVHHCRGWPHAHTS